MIFETTVTPEGTRLCYVDGYPVPEEVYDGLLPSKLFPSPDALPREKAEEALEKIKAEAPPAPPHKGPYFGVAISGSKPWVSDSLAVHSSQIEAVKARNAKHGLNIDYTKKGQPICTDAGQRKKLMKIEGVRQQNSFTGY